MSNTPKIVDINTYKFAKNNKISYEDALQVIELQWCEKLLIGIFGHNVQEYL